MLVPINEVGSVGIITDRNSHELPLHAWSDGRNVRMVDGSVQKIRGQQQAFGTPTVAPYYAQSVIASSIQYWIYCGLAKVYATDGTTHSNLTRQSVGVDVDYGATTIKNWTGGTLGGIPILNNGVDLPQFWSPVGISQRLQNLTNWPSTYRAGAMRVYRRYLMAFDILKNTTRYPQMVKWSHAAPSGAIPDSWDETDETKDAGEYEIVDTPGAVIDGVRMRDSVIIYKEDSVHAVQYVGGVDIFKFPSLFDSFGILSRRCAVEYKKGQHAVFALGDIITHDGQSWESIVSGRLRKWVFNQIDPTNWQTSFVTANPAQYEVWFCFPALGSSLPNYALVWNYQYNTTSIRELSSVSHITPGIINLPDTSDIWDGDSGTWDSDPAIWGEVGANPAGQRLLFCQPADPTLQYGDSTNQFSGVNMTSYVERLGLSLPTTRDGPPDLRARKFIKDLWLRITGTTGGIIKVYLGYQDVPGGTVTWQQPRNFTIGVTQHVDCRISARLLCIKLESTTDIDWKLAGYEVDVVKIGTF